MIESYSIDLVTCVLTHLNVYLNKRARNYQTARSAGKHNNYG